MDLGPSHERIEMHKIHNDRNQVLTFTVASVYL
jgi:hypothetical protein